MKEIIIQVFEDIVCKVNNNPNYELTRSPRIDSTINNFLKKLEKKYSGSIGRDFLVEFITYQFTKLIDWDTKFGKGVIQFNWVIGNKALDRWPDRGDNFLYWNTEFRTKHGIHLSQYEKVTVSDEFKKFERERFKGDDFQIIHCLDNELFNRKCKECFVCKFKNGCLKMDGYGKNKIKTN